MDLQRIIQALNPDRLRDVFVNPRAHLSEVTIVLGLAVLIIFILVVVAGLALSPAPEKADAPARGLRSGADTMRMRRRGRRIAGIAALAVILGLVVVGFVFTGRPQTCSGCHSKPDLVKAWTKGTHASVSCYGCHAVPGPLGAVAARTWVVGDMVRQRLRLSPMKRDAFVSNDACVSCHADSLSKTITVASVRMRHQEPVAAGASCVDCHAGAAHGRLVSGRSSPAMSSCLPCHDGTRAPATCPTCHVEDVGAVNQTALDDFPKLPPMGKPKTCRGCHPIDSCNRCHGLELPHSEEFVKGGHAMPAAFERKKMCRKCHDFKVFCNQCHGFNADGSSPHVANFKAVHADRALQTCGCHRLSRPAMCKLCHDSTTGP